MLLTDLKYFILSVRVLGFWIAGKLKSSRDFPGGPVVDSSPSHVGDVGLIPGQGTKSLCSTIRESLHAQQRPSLAKKKSVSNLFVTFTTKTNIHVVCNWHKFQDV